MSRFFPRKLLFRQRLYLVNRDPLFKKAATISFERLAKLPLILPSSGNVTRTVLDRAFAAAGVSANVVAEADVWSSILAAVRTGMGSTVLPKGNLSDVAAGDLAGPLLIEPPLFLTASIISSGDFPLTFAADAVRNVLIEFAQRHLQDNGAPGAEWVG